MNDKIFLPGSGRQLECTLNSVKVEKPAVLVIGSFSAAAAKKLASHFGTEVNLIVDDTESFLNTNLILNPGDAVKSSFMSYELTDFDSSVFDLVYAQASISGIMRNKIVKEIKRILKPGGFLSVGEIVKLKKDIPPFVNNIFLDSELDPLFTGEINDYYTKRNFTLIEEADFTDTLKEYYRTSAARLEEARAELTENEKKYNKKLLNKISHETNAYLKLGAEKFIGFKYLLLQKGEN